MERLSSGPWIRVGVNFNAKARRGGGKRGVTFWRPHYASSGSDHWFGLGANGGLGSSALPRHLRCSALKTILSMDRGLSTYDAVSGK
jgi:hypothetical protein